MVDQIGQQRGRHLKICLTIVNSIENNWINGYDIRTWFAEKLVDDPIARKVYLGQRFTLR